MESSPLPCAFCSWSPDNPDYPFVCQTGLWRVVLAPNQCLLGRCVVHLKRHCGDLADLAPQELLEWQGIVIALENALRSAFDATMFNWSCYMNHAYRDEPPNPHIHWWVVPRYSHPVTLGPWTFADPDFGNPYEHSRRLELPPEVRTQITQRLQIGLARQNL